MCFSIVYLAFGHIGYFRINHSPMPRPKLFKSILPWSPGALGVTNRQVVIIRNSGLNMIRPFKTPGKCSAPLESPNTKEVHLCRFFYLVLARNWIHFWSQRLRGSQRLLWRKSYDPELKRTKTHNQQGFQMLHES